MPQVHFLSILLPLFYIYITMSVHLIVRILQFVLLFLTRVFEVDWEDKRVGTLEHNVASLKRIRRHYTKVYLHVYCRTCFMIYYLHIARAFCVCWWKVYNKVTNSFWRVRWDWLGGSGLGDSCLDVVIKRSGKRHAFFVSSGFSTLVDSGRQMPGHCGCRDFVWRFLISPRVFNQLTSFSTLQVAVTEMALP